MDDLIQEFVAETNESLEALDSDLVKLEQDPQNTDLLSNIFRVMHTIKGTCGFIGLSRLEKVAHNAENLLGQFRDGTSDITTDRMSLIFESIDRVGSLIDTIEKTGQEPEGDDQDLIHKLEAAFKGEDLGTEAAAEDIDNVQEGEAEKDHKEPEASPKEQPETKEKKKKKTAKKKKDPKPKADANQDDVNIENIKVEDQKPEPVKEEEEKEKEKDLTPDPAQATPQQQGSAVQQTLRVSVPVLENLMTMVSELVLVRNELLQMGRENTADTSGGDLNAPLQRLNHIVSDLQEGVMQTRMQPIGNAWTKLPRIVRDIANDLGKKIDLVMDGEATEVDRQILDMIKDPLTHMVRNSADHGIERPDERADNGKGETGTVELKAYQEGGFIVIELNDDGKGIDPEKIGAKAIENGIATEEEIGNLTDKQILQFIFKAGFSTAEQVTAVSGRGVGMDVVRTNIEKIGGSVDIDSKKGEGSSFQIKIPLTLAIVPALIVSVRGKKFAIPQIALGKLILVTESQIDERIDYINNTMVYKSEGAILPLINLGTELYGEIAEDKEDQREIHKKKSDDDKAEHKDQEGKHPPVEKENQTQACTMQENGDAEQPKQKRSIFIVTVNLGKFQYGIVVDRVFDTQEIVVKPNSQVIKNVQIFSGNTILGDGSVIMILDPLGVGNLLGELDQSSMQGGSDDDRASVHDKLQTFLIFKTDEKLPKAILLNKVARLEKIEFKDIEYSGSEYMIQYRESLMTLKTLDNSPIPEPDLENNEELFALVFEREGGHIGLVSTEIVDVLNGSMSENEKSKLNNNLITSIIVDEKTVEFVNIEKIIGEEDVIEEEESAI